MSHQSDKKSNFQLADCTFGGGNHSVPLLKIYPNLRVLGVDLDKEVLEACKERYSEEIKAKRLALEYSNYVNLQAIDVKQSFGKKIGIRQDFDMALLDLGFSSYQLENPERGFSYIGTDDQPLDMRFDSTNSDHPSAFDIVNHLSELELSDIFQRFGDERFHSQLAKKMVESRQGRMIKTTGELKEVIRQTFSQTNKDDRNQSIKRVFQALRIATNHELLNLQKFLETCHQNVLSKESLLMVITFHSIEEQMIMQAMAKWRKSKKGEMGTKKPILPSDLEISENSRSKSAKLYSFIFKEGM